MIKEEINQRREFINKKNVRNNVYDNYFNYKYTSFVFVPFYESTNDAIVISESALKREDQK